jgi:hypothetical protein
MNFTCDAPFNNNRFVQRLAISQTGHQKTFTAAFSDNLCNRRNNKCNNSTNQPQNHQFDTFSFSFLLI